MQQNMHAKIKQLNGNLVLLKLIVRLFLGFIARQINANKKIQNKYATF
jgi:hypothetical protein